jgi:hypothetical protein
MIIILIVFSMNVCIYISAHLIMVGVTALIELLLLSKLYKLPSFVFCLWMFLFCVLLWLMLTSQPCTAFGLLS